VNFAQHPLVSIVVPVYQGAETLPECLNSILAQTYPHWDCTIVDNCSTDKSAVIAQQYVARDSRMHLIRNSTLLPPLTNHNAALRQVSPTSKYCKVVFADDWIFPECLEEMVAIAENHPSVGVVGAYWLQGEDVGGRGLERSRRLVSGREICRRHFLDKLYIFGSANSVLYRSDLVRPKDRFYNEANIHADTEVCFDLLKTSDFGFVHRVLTFTRVRPFSLSASSADLQTNFAGALHALLSHGKDYLTAGEMQSLLDQRLSDYYSFLGTSVFRRRGKAFWGYHRAQLDATFGFSWTRLTGATIRSLGKAALSPRVTIEKLRKRRHEPGAGSMKGEKWNCQI
jgi:glycosyltransferase involved in cell wall biosynthesis